MKNKYLNKDGINEKYDHKGNIISISETLGIVAGLGYSVASVGYDAMTNIDLSMNCVKDVSMGVGVALISWFGGEYLSKRNKKNNEKALRNLEDRTLK